MTRRKTKTEIAASRTARRANMKRGMKIALYEINQVLAKHGVGIEFPPGFVEYTVSIAEAGRKNASTADRIDAVLWDTMTSLHRIARARAFVEVCSRVFK